ncbi:hypothetical protein BDF22DRAFT_701484 [Syncephalis plumigaleata]|nr:hypothetical protein BDF22DRAFT_701484 [Syncephalis plumigaleata]
MCDIKLAEHGWIEDAIVDKGLFIYSRRPDIARFRMYRLPYYYHYYTQSNNDNPATAITNSGPVINERIPERIGLCRLSTTTNITRILLAEVRQQDLTGNFDFKVRLVSNAGQSGESSRDITRRWTHTQVVDTLYHSMDNSRMNSNFNQDGYDDDDDYDADHHHSDEPNLLALSKPTPIITSGSRITIVAFPHSQVLYSLDEVNEVQGQYKLRPLEIPYVENVVNSVTGLHVNYEGTHLAIVTADNTVMLFTRGMGDSLLDLLLRDDTRSVDNNEGENKKKDRYDSASSSSGSHQLNLLRNARDDLALRWRLKAIIPTRSNVTSIVDAAFVDGVNKVEGPILVLLHADDSLSLWQITDIYATWSWPLILYSEHWILCLILLFTVTMFTLHELRLR